MKNLLLFNCMTFLLLYESLSLKNEVYWHLCLNKETISVIFMHY